MSCIYRFRKLLQCVTKYKGVCLLTFKGKESIEGVASVHFVLGTLKYCKQFLRCFMPPRYFQSSQITAFLHQEREEIAVIEGIEWSLINFHYFSNEVIKWIFRHRKTVTQASERKTKGPGNESGQTGQTDVHPRCRLSAALHTLCKPHKNHSKSNNITNNNN